MQEGFPRPGIWQVTPLNEQMYFSFSSFCFVFQVVFRVVFVFAFQVFHFSGVLMQWGHFFSELDLIRQYFNRPNRRRRIAHAKGLFSIFFCERPKSWPLSAWFCCKVFRRGRPVGFLAVSNAVPSRAVATVQVSQWL
jgi:hypothetical protein